MSTTTHQSLLFIQSYMLETFGPHYPREIPQLIVSIYNDLIRLQIFCGGNHTMIITKNNELYACGNNYYGQLGLSDTNKRNTFTKVDIPNTRCEQSSNPTTRCNFVGSKIRCGCEQSSHLVFASTADSLNPQRIFYPNVLSVSCGSNHTMILTTDNELYACGSNNYGQLGLGDRNARNTFTKVDIPTMRREQSSHPTTSCNKVGSKIQRICDSNVLSVTCGARHTIIITKNNELYSCGDNDYGQLGLGDNNNRNIFTKVDIPNVLSVACGSNHTMIITKNNELYACGNNEYG
jgi:alpha-tubulin suppressor-like RCC1 family protein